MTWQLDTDFIEPTIGEFRYEIKTIWIMQTIGTAWMAGLCHYEDEPPPDEVLLEGRRRSQILLASAIRTISPAQRQQFNFLDPKFRPMCAEEGMWQSARDSVYGLRPASVPSFRAACEFRHEVSRGRAWGH